jgi:hypothetical protein
MMETSGVDGFWIHLDADVLDDAIMSAVDSRQPGGLSHSELVELLRGLLRSGLAVGMEVTIFDPELDPTGEIADGSRTPWSRRSRSPPIGRRAVPFPEIDSCGGSSHEGQANQKGTKHKNGWVLGG